jgi:nucleotide-binding universal stress UspA family protein
MARRRDRCLLVVHVSRLGGLTPLQLTERAAAELCRVTAERAADVIVLGASVRSRLKRSVPAWLARRTPCPAVVVP